MLTISKNEENNKKEPPTSNYSDDELIFKELYLKCQKLQYEKQKMLKIRRDLLNMNKENDCISKRTNLRFRLLTTKTDYKVYESNLSKSLYQLKLSTEKQKILSKKSINDFLEKKQSLEKYYTVSPKTIELDELLKKNRQLQEEWESKSDLLKLTKKQYYELLNFSLTAFQKKVCEFCDVVQSSHLTVN